MSMTRKLFALLKWLSVAIVLVRVSGLVARQVRDAHINQMLRTGVDALEESGFVVFLDWSSLLGHWREDGILEDEEDCDLGVIVPEGMVEQDLSSILKSAFQSQGNFAIIMEQGLVFAEP